MDFDSPKPKKTYTPMMAHKKAEAFCVYQERCHQEVRDKLYEWGLHSNEVEAIISQLISDSFINEERFAKAYAGGKFRIKQWGRIKIRIALKQKKISDYCIRKGLAEIDGDEYIQTLQKVIADKSRTVSEKHPQKRNYKLAQYAMSRGFEGDLVWEVLKGIY
jgi:regulatory protein